MCLITSNELKLSLCWNCLICDSNFTILNVTTMAVNTLIPPTSRAIRNEAIPYPEYMGGLFSTPEKLAEPEYPVPLEKWPVPSTLVTGAIDGCGTDGIVGIWTGTKHVLHRAHSIVQVTSWGCNGIALPQPGQVAVIGAALDEAKAGSDVAGAVRQSAATGGLLGAVGLAIGIACGGGWGIDINCEHF